MRLLQDICSVSGVLPSIYWLNEIVKATQRVGIGAEATIWLGTHQGLEVVIREPHIPNQNGRSINERNTLLAVSAPTVFGLLIYI